MTWKILKLIQDDKTKDAARAMNKQYKPVFELVEKAGDRLLKHFGKIETLKYKNDIHDTSALTQLDLDTEKLLTKGLLKFFPDTGICGEEFGLQGNETRYWTIDPIDGTAHFVRGNPFCTTMIALVEENQVVFSLIYDFLNKKLYWAEKGKGAFCNKNRLQVSHRPINRSYISFETNLSKADSLDKYTDLDAKAVLFHSINCGWEFAMTACGKLDGRITYNGFTSIWDQAPGSLLVAEAGGIVTNVGSKTYDVTNLNVIATNPEIYQFLTTSKQAIFSFEK